MTYAPIDTNRGQALAKQEQDRNFKLIVLAIGLQIFCASQVTGIATPTEEQRRESTNELAQPGAPSP
jgi:hypothetical protein